MAIKRYFRKVREMLRQDKLFSSLYIAGTAMAILMTMVVFIFNYIMVAPIYPEYDRDKTMVIDYMSVVDSVSQSSTYSGSSLKLVREWWYNLENAELVTAVLNAWKENVMSCDKMQEFPVKPKYVDNAFFSLVHFDFIEGKPFSESDFNSGLKKAVITESLARRLFGSAKGVIGRTFMMSYKEYTIVGVVKDTTVLASMSFAHVYAPYTANEGADFDGGFEEVGSFGVYVKVKDNAQAEALIDEVNGLVNRYNTSSNNQGRVMTVFGPDPYWKNYLRDDMETISWSSIFMRWGCLVIIFLVVPALNMGSIVSGQMETRLPEFGISKAFGASRSTLLWRVVNENLTMTAIGGAVGLVATWIAIYFGRNWIFTLFDVWGISFEGTDTIITPSMLFSPWVFLMAFATCVVLNLMSALIPVWKAMRKDIVYSLNQKK